METISHRCDVLAFNAFLETEKKLINIHDDEESQADKYYLAGTHNAIEKTVQHY